MANTPTYQGGGQPTSSSGGLFGGLFGNDAPSYGGDGQPTQTSSGGFLAGLFGDNTPAYQAAPVMSQDSCSVDDPDADPFAGPGPIAVVIQRPPQT